MEPNEITRFGCVLLKSVLIFIVYKQFIIVLSREVRHIPGNQNKANQFSAPKLYSMRISESLSKKQMERLTQLDHQVVENNDLN